MILTSLLDTDLYKLSMQQAVLELYPGAEVQYLFTNRRLSDRFSERFFNALKQGVEAMRDLSLTLSEYEFLSNLPFLKPGYLAYLKNYRFNPDQVRLFRSQEGELGIWIEGPWHETILWEVPLMALISELYFTTDKSEWSFDAKGDNSFRKRSRAKAEALNSAGCHYADFGTRRRRCYEAQRQLILSLYEIADENNDHHFVGTSNVHFAHRFNLKAIGTMAHEWIMGVSELEGLRHANRFALQGWQRVYNGSLGIALTDTFGSEAFFGDFDTVLSRQFDGVRQDSGDPHEFARRAIQHYQSLRIDPTSKTIVFSDSLNVEKAIAIQKEFGEAIKCSYGIGTHFTNDFPEAYPALNMVIKLWEINGVPVVKLGDDAGKSQGDADAVRVARWTFEGKPLDKEIKK